MAFPFEAAQAGYRNLWNKAAVKPGTDDHNADLFAGKIIAGEGQYRQVQAATGVPWFFVGALHMREGSCDFERALCNGEKIIGTGRLTTLVPAGRGPYASWYDSGIDAMKLKDLQRVQDWSIERMLYSAEVYNGLGYLGKVNSPYVWAGTTNEQSGKYVADHVFDPNAEDAQLGVAAVLKRLAEKRPDIASAVRADGSAPTQEILSPLAKAPPELDARIARLEQLLVPLLQQLASGQPLQLTLPAPAAKPEPKADPAKPPVPMTERPSFLAGALALLTGGVAQLNGNIPPPIGETANLTGILTTVLPIATMFLGGPIASAGTRLFSGFTKWAAKRQSP